MHNGYHIGEYRGEFCAKLWKDGRRVGRFTLGTHNREEAERQIKLLNAKLEQEAAATIMMTIDYLMGWYIADREEEGKVSIYRMKQAREILKPYFGALLPAQIDKALCRKFIKARQDIAIKNSTIRTELAYLSAALRFGVDMKLIDSKPRIWRPARARPRSAVEDYHLTRNQADRLLSAAKDTPHLRL
jgi:hypothetical protein